MFVVVVIVSSLERLLYKSYELTDLLLVEILYFSFIFITENCFNYEFFIL